jgi:hypothetical protein
MNDWTKVVTEPLGLAGFALFLVFGLLSRVKGQTERRWLGPLASGMAILALAGGLVLAYLKVSQREPSQMTPAAAVKAAPPTQTNQVQQTTTGAGSPVVQGVQGDVIIDVDQSSGTGAKKDSSQKKAGKSGK